MTAEEWATCDKPWLMGWHLDALRRNRPSLRKLRLADCAVYRRLWGCLDDRDREAVELVERFADGMAGGSEVAAAFRAAESFTGRAVLGFTRSNKSSSALFHSRFLLPADRQDAEAAHQACVLRDIVGDPFRPVAWATAGRTPTTVAIARTAYDERRMPDGTFDPAHLPVLADALEEAGCSDADILEHCRGPGPHVRGCFVVDLVLGLM